MNKTDIGWTGLTLNIFSGCTPISEECEECYANSLATDKAGTAAFPHGFGFTPRPHRAGGAAAWQTPTLIFTNSMSDPGLSDAELRAGDFVGGPHEGALQRLADAGYENMDAVRDHFFDITDAVRRHRYQVLTKRPSVLLDYFRRRGRRLSPAVWMGVTIGSPAAPSMARLRQLRKFRDFGAMVLFISAEPLLGDLPLDLSGIDWIIPGGESGRHASDPEKLERRFLVRAATREEKRAGSLSWVPRADRMDRVRRIRDDAARTGTAVYFKQWGGPRPKSGGRMLDGVTLDGMPDHIPGAMPAGYEHAKRHERRQLPLLPVDAFEDDGAVPHEDVAASHPLSG